MSLLVTVYLEPMVVKVGGDESLATVAEQLGACQYSVRGISVLQRSIECD